MESTPPSNPKRLRWYDRNPRLSVAVQLMMVFPDEFKTIICEGISLLAEREFKVNELIYQFKSLGSDKVLSLFKSKQRKRDYDEHPAMHQTMNYLYVLSDEHKTFMANHIISLVEVVQDYLRLCQRARHAPESQAVGTLTNAYVNTGRDSARVMLKQFEARFIETVQTRAYEISVNSVQRMEKIRSEDNDMRVRDD